MKKERGLGGTVEGRIGRNDEERKRTRWKV